MCRDYVVLRIAWYLSIILIPSCANHNRHDPHRGRPTLALSLFPHANIYHLCLQALLGSRARSVTVFVSSESLGLLSHSQNTDNTITIDGQ